MKKSSLIVAVALSAAAVTSAQKVAPTGSGVGAGSGTVGNNVISATVVSETTFNGTTETVVNVGGEQSWDLLGDPSNTVLSVPLSAGAEVTGIGWDVTCQTVGGSWLSEAQFAFAPSTGVVEVFLTPSATGSPGTESNASPIVVLADVGIPNIALADGTLLIELDETFDDIGDAVDADWTAGSLTIQHTGSAGGVPTVGQWGLILLTTLLFAGVVGRSVSSRKTAPTVG